MKEVSDSQITKVKIPQSTIDKREWIYLRNTMTTLITVCVTMFLTVVLVKFGLDFKEDVKEKEYFELQQQLTELKILIKENKDICVHKDTTITNNYILPIKRIK